eukprot:6460135-Amphidinium_carterae.1
MLPKKLAGQLGAWDCRTPKLSLSKKGREEGPRNMCVKKGSVSRALCERERGPDTAEFEEQARSALLPYVVAPKYIGAQAHRECCGT